MRARAIWCGCQFAAWIAEKMSEDFILPILEGVLVFVIAFHIAVLLAMKNSEPVLIRLSAGRGIGFLLKSCTKEHDELIKRTAEQAVSSLCELLELADGDTLDIILDSLRVVVEQVC